MTSYCFYNSSQTLLLRGLVVPIPGAMPIPLDEIELAYFNRFSKIISTELRHFRTLYVIQYWFRTVLRGNNFELYDKPACFRFKVRKRYYTDVSGFRGSGRSFYFWRLKGSANENILKTAALLFYIRPAMSAFPDECAYTRTSRVYTVHPSHYAYVHDYNTSRRRRAPFSVITVRRSPRGGGSH